MCLFSHNIQDRPFLWCWIFGSGHAILRYSEAHRLRSWELVCAWRSVTISYCTPKSKYMCQMLKRLMCHVIWQFVENHTENSQEDP